MPEYALHLGDCLDVMAGLPANSIDSIITDPPYGLDFMGKDWDHGIPGVPFWQAALRVAKPGAFLLAFGGTRTFHRLAVAIEDAGWEIRDCIFWTFGSGFPKSHSYAWKMHLEAASLCGDMVKLEHEETQPIAGRNGATQVQTAGEKSPPEYGMRFVRATYLQMPVYACAECGQVLQPFVSEQNAREHRAAWEKSEVVWPKQSGVEGRRYLEKTEGELWRCEVCTLSSGVFADGAEGRVHNGASAHDGAIPWQVSNEDGSRPSYRPQSIEQLHRQPDSIRNERRAQTFRGYGTALKPAWEPIIVAMKPLSGTFAQNALEHGVAGLNIDGARVGTEEIFAHGGGINADGRKYGNGNGIPAIEKGSNPHAGRWPANLIHDGSEEVLAGFPETSSNSGNLQHTNHNNPNGIYGKLGAIPTSGITDRGSAARFFYCAKASRGERNAGLEGMEERDGLGEQVINAGGTAGIGNHNPVCQTCGGSKIDRGGGLCSCDAPDWKARNNKTQNHHPTVKPLALMRYLCRLTRTPTGGVVLDPFMGSGSTGCGAVLEGRDFIGIDLEPEYVEIARRRIEYYVLPMDREAAAQPPLFPAEPQPKPRQTKFTG